MNITLNNDYYCSSTKNDLLVSKAKDNEIHKEDNNLNRNDVACIYKPYENEVNKFSTYNKNLIETNATRAVDVAANKNAQNYLKKLGFYSGSVVSDGNMLTDESIKAIKNFQTAYGLTANGMWNKKTESMLTNAINEYNKVFDSSGVVTVARIKSDYSDYNEDVIKKNVSRIWAFLKVGMQLDDVHAAALMGNIMEESGASANNAQDTDGDRKLFDSNYQYKSSDGRGYGIIQWTYYSRKEGLEKMATDMGLSTGDINAQLAYLRKESEESYNSQWKKFLQTGTIDDATNVFRSEFEQTPNGAEERKKWAHTVYNSLC